MLYLLFKSLAGGEHYAHENVLFRGVCAALFCFVVMLFLTPSVIRQLIRFKLGDRPEFDHVTLNQLTRDKSNVPTMGGIMLFATIAAAILLFADPTNFYVQMALMCLVWLTALGAVDDWFKLTQSRRSGTRDGLKFYEKLLFQIGLGVLLGYFVFSFGRSNFAVVSTGAECQAVEAYRVLAIPFYKKGALLGAYSFMLIAVLVITATSNAVNLTDGMDGLASGCVAASAAVFMIVSYLVGDAASAGKLLLPHVPLSGELSVVCGAILGSTVGFLWHNCHPARVFMGDTGSLPLGGLIGYVAVVTRQELMLLIAGGVFVIEMLSVVLQVGYFKMSGGRRLFLVAPIHHHFHVAGWTVSQRVVIFLIVAGMFAALALATIKLR